MNKQKYQSQSEEIIFLIKIIFYNYNIMNKKIIKIKSNFMKK